MTWTTGSWSGVVAPGGLALVEPSASPSAIAGLWGALHQDSPRLVSLLDCFIASCGGTLAGMPGFALVVPGADGVHVALRGPVVLEAGDQRLTAGAVSSWFETTLVGVSSLSLTAPESPTQPSAVVSLALDGGTLRVAQPVAAPPTAQPKGQHDPHGEGAGQADDADDSDDAGDADDSDDAGDADDSVLGDHDGWTVAALPEELTGELRQLMDEVSPEPGAAAEHVDQAEQGQDPDRPDAADHAGQAGQPSEPEGIDWGVWQAAVSKTTVATPEVPWDDDAPQVAQSQEPASQGTAGQADEAAGAGDQGEEPGEIDPTLEVGSVWDLGGEQGASQPDGVHSGGVEHADASDRSENGGHGEPSGSGENDGHGVDQGADEQGAEDSSSAQAPARQALSVLCPNGHTNPTNRIQCRVCGAILLDSARLMDCPPLGRLRIGSQELELDRSVLIGRQPAMEAMPRYDGPRPHLVTVDDPEQVISRSHLLILLDEWSVLACNLSSGNGTTLRRQGAAPIRLTSPDPVLLRSGDVLDLGGGHTIVLEDLP